MTSVGLFMSANTLRVLRVLRDYPAAHHGRPPTRREIAEQGPVSSTSVVDYNLRKLATYGLADLGDPTLARDIRITDRGREYLAAVEGEEP